jgi:hypothetical protein
LVSFARQITAALYLSFPADLKQLSSSSPTSRSSGSALGEASVFAGQRERIRYNGLIAHALSLGEQQTWKETLVNVLRLGLDERVKTSLYAIVPAEIRMKLWGLHDSARQRPL